MSSLKDSHQKQAKVYWRSLAELADDPAFREHLEKEFPDADLGNMNTFSRRRFMQLMGASMGLATGSACRWDKEKILPFTRKPAGLIEGVPQHYATSMELGGYAQPLLVTSYDGRPIKIEGNAQHPLSLGGTSTFAQASVLELYDPDRSQYIADFGTGVATSRSFDEFVVYLAALRKKAEQTQGQGLRVLAEVSSSPTRARLQQRFLARYPQAKWITYDPLFSTNAQLGSQLAFGRALLPELQLAQARVIVAFDDDFLVAHPASVRYAHDFAQARKPRAGMVRVYAAESRHSTTGAMADHRLAVRSEQIKGLLIALLAEVVKDSSLMLGLPEPIAAAFGTYRNLHLKGFFAEAKTVAFIKSVAQDLLQYRGASVVTVGAGQGPEVHAMAHALNVLLQNNNHTVLYRNDTTDAGSIAGIEGLQSLVEEMSRGAVSTLLILGGNPVFNTSANVRFAEALKQVTSSIHLSLFQNETSRACSLHVPRAHYLEAWGDARAFDGSVTLQQPVIAPLYNGKSDIELLALLLNEPNAQGLALLQDTWVPAHSDKDKTWHDAVQKGFFANTSRATVTPVLQPLPASLPALAVDERTTFSHLENGSLELTFWQDPHVYDGRFANNGWLQELPDFMSKVTWDNVATFAPKTAEALGIKHQHLVKLHIDRRELLVAAYIMPGQAADTVAVTLGYGRTAAGHIGGSLSLDIATVGFDTYKIWPGISKNYAPGLQADATATFYELAVTQDHHALDAIAQAGRDARVGEIVREATLAEYLKNPDFAKEVVEHPPLESLWTEFSYNGVHRWGMGVDLNACIGCNACVVACQAENNVPIVGKEQIIKGRQMHWIRVDRYFSGDVAAPEVTAQIMLCQHCENAPCEQVCPVAATVHSEEGLNAMVYNRCIGTRYCSNNCPYKVRRFNFFNYHKNLVDPKNQVAKMVYNPEVTVRARGVMEKCTYCVQRIQNVKIIARNNKRPIQDGEITPACAQACPAHAITFGDLNDPRSAVAQDHANSRAYKVLEELNTKPRTAYLARVRNPNPELG